MDNLFDAKLKFYSNWISTFVPHKSVMMYNR